MAENQDYAENLFKAVEILINKKIEEVKFDETINAIITDASMASDGKYMVEFNGTRFIAYSNETNYKENDSVMVTIPQGNFENQKMIIGKYVSDTETPLTYQSPMEQLVNLTTNLIGRVGQLNTFSADPNASPAQEISLYANHNAATQFLWDTDTQVFPAPNNGCWWEWSIPQVSTPEAGDTEAEEEYPTKQAAAMAQAYQKYSRIAIQAQFSTWLEEYQTATGNYGLALELTFQYLDISQGSSANRYFTKIITLDSDDFFGDVYNFETYYTQTKVYDLSSYVDFPIVKMRLFPYQRSNFYDIYKELIPSPDNPQEGVYSTLVPNIFIKDPMICLGIDSSEFEADYATLECLDDSTLYTKSLEKDGTILTVQQRDANNERHVHIRWIHKDDVSEFIQLIENDNMPANYEIRWYRNKLGVSSPDIFAGAHWERLNGTWDTSPTKDGSYELQANSEDQFTNRLEITLKPDVNAQASQIKAIVVRKQEEGNAQLNTDYSFVCATNILTFTNQQEVRNNASIVDANTLVIRYDDNSGGSYFIYNRAGQLYDGQEMEVHTLTAIFDPEISKPLAQRSALQWTSPDVNDTLQWIFPNPKQSMIQPVRVSNGKIEKITSSSEEITIPSTPTVQYIINKTLATNRNVNKVELRVHKDGQDYSAFSEMYFGTAGTSGSDYTLILTWNSNNVALEASENKTLIGTVTLRDNHNELIDIPSEAELEWSWAAAAGDDIVSSSATEDTDKELYYPISDLKPVGVQAASAYVQKDDNYTYYTYDIDSKEFVNANNSDTIRYQKKSGQTKIDFVPIKTVIADSENASNAGNIVTAANGQRTYYYSTSKRLFVKYKDVFIIDPWDAFDEAETYYEPVETKEKVYSNQHMPIGVTLNPDNGVYALTLRAKDNTIDINQLYILRLTLKSFGDYNLIADYPVPLKQSDQPDFVVSFIEGTTSVRYAATGEVDFAKEPYQIYCQKYENNEWKLYTDNPQNDNEEKLNGYWRLVYYLSGNETAVQSQSFLPSLNEQRPSYSQTTSFSQGTTYYIQNNENYTAADPQPTAENFSEGSYFTEKWRNVASYDTTDEFTNSPTLLPPGVYFKDAPLYGVQFVKKGDNNTETVLWTQPILAFQDNYPSNTLNQWNGKDIKTDNEKGTIIANGFAAGKKEDDNTFTGVVLGDWSRTDTDRFVTKQTGVYGFNHGAMSYALKDDGTAFFGKDGSGRIYFNGNSAQIYSSGWIAKANDKKGMLIDVDDGYIKMIGDDKTKITLQTNSSPYFQIDVPNGNNNSLKSLIEIGSNNYYLQSKDFSNDSGSEAGVKFDLENGQLTGYNLKIHAKRTATETYNPSYSQSYYTSWNPGTLSGDTWTEGNWSSGARSNDNSATDVEVQLDSSARNFPFKIGSNFKVSWNGYLDAAEASFNGLSAANANINSLNTSNFTAYSGTIGGWTIQGDTIRTTGITLDSAGSISAGDKLTVSYISAGSGVIGDFSSDGDHIGMKYGGASSTGTGYVACYQSSVDLGPTVSIRGTLDLSYVSQITGSADGGALVTYLAGFFKRKD